MSNKTPTPGKTYDDWLKDTLAIVVSSQDILKDPLDPASMNHQATQAEEFQVKLTEALSQASAWLDFAKARELGNINADKTVLEKTILLDVAVMEERILRDKLEGLAMSMRSRMRRAAWGHT